ncbi:unnamed protein product [Rhodiola kirilowii]
MSSELDALEHNKTWVILPLPAGKIPIGCNGFIESSTTLMDLLSDIKLG